MFNKGISPETRQIIEADPFEESQAIELFTDKLAAGEKITDLFLERLPVSSKVRGELKELAAKQNPANGASGSKSAKSFLKASLMPMIGLTDSTQTKAELEQIMPYAEREYSQVLSEQLKFNLDPFQAEAETRKIISERIKNKEGVFASSGEIGSGFSWNVLNKGPLTSTTQTKAIIKQASTESGRESILADTAEYFGDATQKGSLAFELHQIDKKGNGSNLAVYNVARSLGMTEGQLIRKVLEDQGIDTREASRYAVEEYVDPDISAFIADRSYMGKTHKGLMEQARRQGAEGVERYKPMLELIRSKESSNDQKHGGYDAMNLGGTQGGHVPIGTGTGTNYFGQPLMTYSIRELLGMYDQKKIHAAGSINSLVLLSETSLIAV